MQRITVDINYDTNQVFINDVLYVACDSDIELVKLNGLHIKDICVTKLTQEICDLAVNQNELALEYVPKEFQQDKLCLIALLKNNSVLPFIKNERILTMYKSSVKKTDRNESDDQAIDISLEDIKKDGLKLQFVGDQTEEVCLEAVKQNGAALQFVWRLLRNMLMH